MSSKYDLLKEVAESIVGVTEEGGDNKGPMVEEFQKAVDGISNREPWCLAMVQWSVLKADLKYDEIHNRSHVQRNTLYPTEHVQTLWDKTPKKAKHSTPKEGYIVCWAFYNSQGVNTGSGHAGIVINVLDGKIVTVEGNTGPDDKTIEREGDGVYKKMRSLKDYRSMKLLGFIDPWG